MATSPITRRRWVLISLLGWCLQSPGWAAASAQFQLPTAVVASGGQLASSSQFGLCASVIGEALGGQSASAQFTLRSGAALKPISSLPQFLLITVSGTVDDPAATVTVNGNPATVSGMTWSISGLVLYPGPNTITAVAQDPAGHTSTQQIVVYFDPVPDSHTHDVPLLITITGTVDDLLATVTVNLVHHTTVSVTRTAMVSGTTWTVAEFPLYAGLNTLTATAQDPAGHTSTHRIQVFVDTAPPARPTVEEPPVVTTASAHTFTGTKQAGTSVWINGAQAVPLNGQTIWSATVTLVEGDNTFEIVTKDAAGNASTTVTLVIVVDNLPPVITVTAPAEGFKTNATTVTVQGTVDDYLTQVDVAGVADTTSGRAFEAVAPLPEIRSYTLTITATSPNGYTSTRALTVIRGTIPTLVSATPRDGGKAYWDQSLTLSITATDPESDPLEYQVRRNSSVLIDWQTNPTATWTPSPAYAGTHTFDFRVRDAFGGEAFTSHEILILRPPVNPP